MAASATSADVGAAFADLAETLATELDIEAYLTALCRQGVSLIGAQSAAIVHAQGRDCGCLRNFAALCVASCDERGRRLARGPAGSYCGPWAECMAAGALITVADVRVDANRWPWFAREAVKAGLGMITVVPVRPLAEVVGALAFLGGSGLDAAGIHLAMSLADAAGAGIVLRGELRRREAVISQLQTALSSRIVIEQAKGILAERWGVAPDEAFGELRQYARASQRNLHDFAGAVIEGSVDLPRLACRA